VTGDSDDNYRFRTPSLRNVALTAPYGHSGSYPDLASVIRHHADPSAGLAMFLPTDADPAMRDDDEALNIFAAISLRLNPLSEDEIAALVAFLQSLTDETPVNGRLGPPEVVPSGLPVEIPGTSRQSALSKPVAQP
jgi:cytochrome c peroxidase